MTTELKRSSFAWTPGAGAYRHYPPYVNLTGNRLTVRGMEDLSGEHPKMGATVAIDLPDEVIAELRDALAQPIVTTDGLVERLRALEPERTRNSEFGTMIYTEAADRIASLERALEPLALLFGGGVNMNDPLSKWLTMAQLQEAHDALSTTHPLNIVAQIDEELGLYGDGERVAREGEAR